MISLEASESNKKEMKSGWDQVDVLCKCFMSREASL